MLASSPIRPAVSEPIALPAKSLSGMRNRDLDDEYNDDNHNVKVNLTAQNEGDGEDYDNEPAEDQDQEFEDASYQGRVQGAQLHYYYYYVHYLHHSVFKYSNTKLLDVSPGSSLNGGQGAALVRAPLHDDAAAAAAAVSDPPVQHST